MQCGISDVRRTPIWRNTRRILPLLACLLMTGVPVWAQASPWENAVNQLQISFTGPIAKGLSLVAIVVGGLMFAYSEGAAKRTFAGILFGCGAALAANNFLTWLFP
jgi:type IV secretory pathway VirB2 component (pilin)